MGDIVKRDGADRFELEPSILDGQYAISLRRVADGVLAVNTDVINRAAEVIADAYAAKEMNPAKDKVQYVVDMSPDLLEKIEKGVVKLDYSKDGRVFAQLRDANNHFGKKLSIKRELINNGVDPQELRMAVQMAAVQQKLQAIVETLDDISEGVSEVLKGQQNDRFGLYYSGMSLMLEAREVQDETMRKLISSQALKALSDATGQLTQDIQEQIRYLLDGDYKKGKKGTRRAELDERMNSINKCFDAIHRAAVLKAAIYFDAGETAALLLAVEEYARFVNRAIAPYAGKLIEFDQSDTLLMDGKWETRVKALSEASELRKALTSETTFYLVPSDYDDEVSEDAIAG